MSNYYDERQYYSSQQRQPSSSQSVGYSQRSSSISSASTSSASPTSDSYSPLSSYQQQRRQEQQAQGLFVCLFSNCSNVSGRKADLERHIASTHNREILSLWSCEVRGCHRVGAYGFPRKDKMVEHMREVHKADIPKRGGVGGRMGSQ